MQVLVSGQAGLVAMQTGSGFRIKRIDSDEAHLAGPQDLTYYFAGCNDVSRLTVTSELEAHKALDKAWSADRAVRLFVILLDPDERPEDLVEVGEALDELLVTSDVVTEAEAQLFSAPLPLPIDVVAIKAALAEAPRSAALLDRFLELQTHIATVRLAFEAIPDEMFIGADERRRLLESSISSGGLRTLVMALSGQIDINGSLFALYSTLKPFENSREIVNAWTAGFERSHLELREEDEGPKRRPTRTKRTVGGRDVFEKVMQQQDEIADRIRMADFDTARRFARELVDAQRFSGSSDHIAKTLTSLSQRAKRLDVLDLALDWATEAVEFKGDDPVTHAQRGDLLMRVGRYVEAGQSLDLAESFGEAGFAVSGRARMLRYQGHFDAALTAYREALRKFGEDDAQNHYNNAGIAECLRDLERPDEALEVYDAAVERHQYEAVLHAGRAATLVDLGRYGEAEASYARALKLDDDNVVPRNGIAALARRAGEFRRAEADYRSIVKDYPFDIHSRVGLVATLREQNRFDEAIAEAQRMIAMLPASPESAWTLADAMIDGGRLEEAGQVLDAAIERFPYSAGLRHGLARVERARGRYEAALALYDDAAARFPSNPWIQVGRANMLRRLGNLEEALRIYRHASERHPQRLSLKNAIASIHIHEGRFNEALELLNVDDPRTADEWRNFALHAMLDVRTGFVDAARERMEWGLSRCPFRRERRTLNAELERLDLRNEAAPPPLSGPRECLGDVADLVWFRAQAALKNKESALAFYEKLRASSLAEPYHELRDEIARNYNVIPFPPRRKLEWVIEKEGEALLLEAA